jgi:protease stability complex PrcB-like protein
MRISHLVTTLSAILAIGSCASPTSPTASIPFTRFPDAGIGLGSGLQQPATLTVRDGEAWQSIWSQIHRNVTPVPPLPAIDFAVDMVVVAAVGAQSTSGYSVTITGASESNGVVTIDAESASPGSTCVTLPVVTYPTDLARLSRREGAVQFRITPRVSVCR